MSWGFGPSGSFGFRSSEAFGVRVVSARGLVRDFGFFCWDRQGTPDREPNAPGSRAVKSLDS